MTTPYGAGTPAVPPRSTSMATSAPATAPFVASSTLTPTPKVDKDPEVLAQEVKKFGGECAVCMDEPQNAICVPCGHNSTCVDCANVLAEKKQGCPVCRKPITQVVRFYPV